VLISRRYLKFMHAFHVRRFGLIAEPECMMVM